MVFIYLIAKRRGNRSEAQASWMEIGHPSGGVEQGCCQGVVRLRSLVTAPIGGQG